MLRTTILRSLQDRAGLGVKMGQRRGNKRLLSIEKNGSSKADMRAARAKRMEQAASAAKKRSKVANAKQDTPLLSGGQKKALGSLVIGSGLIAMAAEDIRKNPMGPLATSYRGSIVENFCDWLYENLVLSWSSVYDPHTDKLLPTYEAGTFYGPVPEGAPAPPLLVLDLEKTLIGSVHDAKYGWRHVKRPGFDKFIDRLSQYYEIVIFSENDKNVELLEAIDPERKAHKLGAESAEARGGVMLKRLDYMNRDVKRIVLIDDSPESSQMFPRNTLLIKPFSDINDKTDTALLDLLPLLQALVHDGVQDFPACFDDLGTNDAHEAALEYKMRVGEAKNAIKAKRAVGLGAVLASGRSGTLPAEDPEERSLLSQIVGDAPVGTTVGGGIDTTGKQVATNLDLAGIGASKHTGVGGSSKKAKVEKRKGTLAQWFEDSAQESDKLREMKMQKMNEMHMERTKAKEEKAKKRANASY